MRQSNCTACQITNLQFIRKQDSTCVFLAKLIVQCTQSVTAHLWGEGHTANEEQPVQFQWFILHTSRRSFVFSAGHHECVIEVEVPQNKFDCLLLQYQVDALQDGCVSSPIQTTCLFV